LGVSHALGRSFERHGSRLMGCRRGKLIWVASRTAVELGSMLWSSRLEIGLLIQGPK
jgi:hypothetical protein